MLARFWIYQRERFPLAGYVPLMAVLSGAAISYSAAARSGRPGPAAWLAAFLIAFGFFFQLRVFDEFKDAADDRAHRPYRPVPRGLITLRELAWLGVLAAGIQVFCALALAPIVLVFVLATWGYMGLMGVEFFRAAWLRRHPLVYLLSHMLILPLIVLTVSACDWGPAGMGSPPAVGALLAASFGAGTVFEIGRKIRGPQEEEPGVQTYSALWGRRTAVTAWLGVMGVSSLCAAAGAQLLGFGGAMGLWALALWVLAARCGAVFLRGLPVGSGKRIEQCSGLWTLGLYLGLGVLPFFRHLT